MISRLYLQGRRDKICITTRPQLLPDRRVAFFSFGVWHYARRWVLRSRRRLTQRGRSLTGTPSDRQSATTPRTRTRPRGATGFLRTTPAKRNKNGQWETPGNETRGKAEAPSNKGKRKGCASLVGYHLHVCVYIYIRIYI